MGKWYVIAGRFTFMEDGAHNAIENYTWNEKEQFVDIDFTFHKDSFDGELKRVGQKGFIINKKSNAYWKVQPFWPLKFDYYVVALDEEYKWTAIGVPSTNYLWIMHREWDVSEEELKKIVEALQKVKYPVKDIVRLPQKWN
jgi:apolipoprotein D and lipocalin family protein